MYIGNNYILFHSGDALLREIEREKREKETIPWTHKKESAKSLMSSYKGSIFLTVVADIRLQNLSPCIWATSIVTES